MVPVAPADTGATMHMGDITRENMESNDDESQDYTSEDSRESENEARKAAADVLPPLTKLPAALPLQALQAPPPVTS